MLVRHKSLTAPPVTSSAVRRKHTGVQRLCLSTFLVFALALVALPAWAQVEGATVRGVISSPEGPASGITVRAVNVANGQSRSTSTGNDGSYVMVNLRPGTYRIQVATTGEGEEVTLRVGQSAVLNFQIGAAAAEPGPDGPRPQIAEPGMPSPAPIEEIVVTGVQVETFTGGEVGTSITPEMMDRLPQVNRNFLAFADLAPGVQFVQNSDGTANIRGGAQHQRAVNVFIDGVSQKDYVLKGGVTGQDTSKGNPFPQSAIAEYKVITQNYKAEYPHVGSTAITAVTASGTNEFHGSVFGDYTNEDLRAAVPLEEQSGEKVASSQSQYGFNVSGPIVRDRLHFLFAYEAKDNEDPVDIVPGGGFTAETLPPEYAALVGREVAEFKEDLYFAKLDWFINDSHDISASVKYRDEISEQGFQNVDTKSFGGSIDQEDTRVQVKHTWNADAWQNEFRITYEDSLWSPNPLTNGNAERLVNASDEAILNVGGGQNLQRKGQDGWGIQNDFTVLDLEWFGGHTIKTGISYKKITLNTLQQLPANPQYFYNVEFNGPGTFELVQPHRVEFGMPLTAESGAVETDNTQWGLYVQDDWYVTERLTLNIGIRWDYEETPIYVDRVTPPAVAAALQSWPNIANANYDISNWISTGGNRDYDGDNIAPRLGFSYDIGEDAMHTIYGGYGRSYDRNQFDFVQLEVTNGTFGRVSFFFEGDPANPCEGTNCVPWDPAYLTPEGLDALVASTGLANPPTEIFLLNNELKTPYSDQFSIGLRSTWGAWDTDLTFSHVESKNGFNWLLGNRRENGEFFAPGAIWGAPFGFTPPGFSNVLLSSNDLETEADSIFLKLDRPHQETWGISFAYTFTDAEENRNFDGTFTLDYPTIEGYGRRDAVGIADHRLVASGTYDLPWEVLLSGKLTLDSGVAFQYTDCLAGPDQCVLRRIEPDDAEMRQLDLAVSKTFNFGFL
ncbi:MAG TPA: TonB-dependent receptor, partial [Woeseiaceae bacterium]|nr:TonB-dependent receptor [Woeseiaceae bacterium]